MVGPDQVFTPLRVGSDMSILLDDREDPEVATRLAQFGLPFTVTRLDYGEGVDKFSAGDLVIQASNGWLIGYERKKLDDMIKCMQDRRLQNQLRNCWKVYDRVEIIFESLYRPGDSGAIEVPRRLNGKVEWVTYSFNGSGISYRQLDSFLQSQYECGGVPYFRTMSTYETVCVYASRWHWWQKDYDLHKSHDVLFSNSPSAQRRGAVTLHQGDPNAVTMLAAQIPGLDAKSWDVGKHFKSPYDMVNATEAEWRRVCWTDRKGNAKHFSKETAHSIMSWLRGWYDR